MTSSLRLVGERLKVYMQARGLTITAVSRMSAFSIKELDAIIDGQRYPISRLLPLLALFEDLNPDWLLHGEGAMMKRGLPRPARVYRDELEAREILRRYAQTRAAPPTFSKEELGQQLDALREEVAGLREVVREQGSRLAAGGL